MPSKTKKQAKLMAAAAHDSEFAKKVGVKQSVAKEFNQADSKVLRPAKEGKVSRFDAVKAVKKVENKKK